MVVLGLPEGGWRLPSALRGGHRCEGSKSLMIAHIMRMYFPLDFDHSRQCQYRCIYMFDAPFEVW
eukprot:COSAG06_NODE_536_length_14513_cov_294.977244_3_plen_65_part_00